MLQRSEGDHGQAAGASLWPGVGMCCGARRYAIPPKAYIFAPRRVRPGETLGMQSWHMVTSAPDSVEVVEPTANAASYGVVQKLRTSCRTVAPGSDIWASLAQIGPNSAKLGPMLAKVGRQFGNVWPISAKTWLQLDEIGGDWSNCQILAEVGRKLPNCGSKFAKFGPTLAEFGPNWAKLAQARWGANSRHGRACVPPPRPGPAAGGPRRTQWRRQLGSARRKSARTPPRRKSRPRTVYRNSAAAAGSVLGTTRPPLDGPRRRRNMAVAASASALALAWRRHGRQSAPDLGSWLGVNRSLSFC